MPCPLLRNCLPILAILVLSGVPLVAHDVWIEPTTFVPEVGRIVGVRLKVGQDFRGDAVPRDPALVNEFVVVDSSGRRPVAGRDGADPAGLLRVAAPGLSIIGYWSNPSAIVLAPEKFNQYLKEEGLEAVAALRARRGQTNAGARELFSRSAKSLVLGTLAGPPMKTQGDRSLGFPLELVAERNPYLMEAGEDLPVRLTYESRPLAGALVVATNRANPSEKLTARSDKDGRVRFRLSRAGVWLVKAVHMVEAPAGTNAEWASYWASLTFEVPSSRRDSSSQRALVLTHCVANPGCGGRTALRCLPWAASREVRDLARSPEASRAVRRCLSA